MKKRSILKVCAVLVLLGFISASLYFLFVNKAGKIIFGGMRGVVAEGVEVGNLSVGGNSYPLLRQRISFLVDQCLDQPVWFLCGSLLRSASFKKLGFEVNTEDLIKGAWLVGRQGSFWKRLVDRYLSFTHGMQVKIKPTYNRALVISNLQRLLGELDRPAQNAQLISSGSQVKIRPSLVGQRVDYEKLVNILESEFCHSLSPRVGPISCTVPLEIVLPERTTEELRAMKIEGLRGSATTYFDPSNRPRADNIELACRHLHGLILAPGQEFSFNQAIGPRTEEAGYQEAIVIEENEFAPGIGGGVCQVSSTLYNAALRSDLRILERSRHSRLVNYVEPGLDAAVAYGSIDLQFLNNSGGYLFIAAGCSNGAVTISIYGRVEHMPEVKIARRVEKVLEPPQVITVDPSLLPGQAFVEEEGSRGFLVTVERVKKDRKGKAITREFISKDLYPARPRVVLVGPSGGLPRDSFAGLAD